MDYYSSTPTPSITDLPLVILFEIIARLSIKFLLRLRCVSKFFNALILDPHTADIHHNLSLTRPGGTTFLLSFPTSQQTTLDIVCYTINLYTDDEANQGILQANRVQFLDVLPYKGAFLRSSTNGLTCLPINDGKTAIFNLSTRQRIHLPRTSLNNDSKVSSWTCVELGLSSITKRYKVLKSDYCDKEIVKHWVLTHGVDKSWREINSFPVNYISFTSSVHINGVIYSISGGMMYFGTPITIGSFDVETENFSEIYFPEAKNPELHNISLVEVNGQLAIICCPIGLGLGNNNSNIDIWILEKSMEWVKHTIPIQLKKGEAIIKGYFLRYPNNHVGEVALLVQQNRSYWMFFNEFRGHIWRKFRICGLDHDFPTSDITVLMSLQYYHNIVEIEESLFLLN